MNQKAVAIGTRASAVLLTPHLQAPCTGRVSRRHQPLQQRQKADGVKPSLPWLTFFFSCCPFLCSRWPPVVHKPTCHRILRTFCVPDTLAWHLMFVFDSMWRAAERVFLPSQWLDLMFTLLLVSCPAILGWGLPIWIHPSRSSTERCKLWTMKLHTSLDLALCWCLFSHREICWYWCLSFFTPFYPNFHRVICSKTKHVWNDKPGAEEGSFKASKITRMYLNRSINKEKRRKRQRNSFFYTPLFWQTHKKVNIF